MLFLWHFAEILVAPQTQHVLLNGEENATFFCQAVGANAFWLINNNTVVPEGNSELIGKGWIFNETLIQGQQNNIHNLTLMVPPVADFNNTEIRCIGAIHDPAYSDTVFLIIKGAYLLIVHSHAE